MSMQARIFILLILLLLLCLVQYLHSFHRIPKASKTQQHLPFWSCMVAAVAILTD